MFKLEDYFFVKEQEAEASAAHGGDAPAAETDVQAGTEGEQDNTVSQEEGDDIDKADDEAKDESNEDKSDEESDGKDGVPENYDFEVPEGLELDKELSDKFTDVAKELGLNNEQANKVVGLYAEKVMDMQKAQTEAWNKQVSDWEGELKSDPEFGGAKFTENAEIARMAINKFGGDELKEALNTTGLGNHPALVKFMHKIGMAMSEDSFNVDEQSQQEKPSSAVGLYKNSNMNP